MPHASPMADAPQHKVTAKQILAIFDIEAKGIAIPPSTLDRLSDFIGVIVLEQGSYRVVPRDQIRGRLHSKKKESYKRCYDHSCQIDIGRELAATKVLSTKIVRLGSQCTVSATIYDLKSATAESAVRRIGDCEESALAAMLIPVMERIGGGKARALPDDPVPSLSGSTPSRFGGGSRSIRLGCDDCEIGVDRESGPGDAETRTQRSERLRRERATRRHRKQRAREYRRGRSQRHRQARREDRRRERDAARRARYKRYRDRHRTK